MNKKSSKNMYVMFISYDDIYNLAEILLKLVLNTNQSIHHSHSQMWNGSVGKFPDSRCEKSYLFGGGGELWKYL